METLSEKDEFCVAAIQTVSSTDLHENLEQAASLIRQAAEQGAQMAVLPEYFCLMGRRDDDKVALRERPGKGPIQQFLSESARRHGLWLVGGTLPLESPDSGRIYNTTLVYDPQGSQAARYDKIHLFGFRRGEEAYDESVTIRPGGSEPQAFEAPCGKVGLSICYDLRFPELYRALGETSLIVVPAAFTYTTGSAHWEILLRARAIENQCYVLAAAQGGKHENGRRTWGHSMLIDPWGDVLDCLPEGPGLALGNISRSRLEDVRQALPALRHRTL
ncbi:carbon-nitrogen hydrolase family protein [Pusillimonas noertemannii]|uniref:Nitrilase n=1 Tax=Pusillimonas noertemannii TaxID=305977 RepID=A0A2U1CKF6_9BURK|nr:carbon-nitrogen hydrolase family protein [Pusillimonas noertemannii]NYT69576.1 carbon-nitrogen hydrolase family protein [Pusillimonas noertemannii]PVY61500.1 nitrilase [Pusillimonas noertemannii]TFL08909.1 carbon-nitrogen hydrolase family protein [Pusillimonas noertemannii]